MNTKIKTNTKSKTKKKLIVPATFRYVAFLDLLVDAAFQHRLATETEDSFTMSRHARASVAAAFLTIECLANCLLEFVEVPKALRDELDKLQPLAKVEIALHLRGKSGYDRGRNEVEHAVEVIKVRNDYVHSKATKVSAKVHEPEDAGTEWMVPFEIFPDYWKTLKIPKQSMFWSSDVSRGILKVVRDFLSYVLVDILQGDEELLASMLMSHVAFGNPETGSTIMPGVFDELKKEIAWLKEQKIDFSFLKFANM